MGYPTDRVLTYDRSGAFAGELAPSDVLSRLRVEQINDEHELTLVTTRVLAEGTRVVTCDGTGKWHEHVVYKPDQEHAKGRHAIGTYQAMWSLQYDLMTAYSHAHAEPGMGSSCTGAAAVRCALDGQSMWDVGTVDVASVAAGKGCVMIGVSGWERLKLVVKHWGGEVDAEITVDGTRVTSRRVALRAHLGSAVARRRFDWGEDLTAIRRRPDPGPYYCRVVPLGRGTREWAEDDETEFDWPVDITEETGGVEYIQDDDAAQAFRTKRPDGTWHYPTKTVRYDEDDPELLLAEATADLHNHTRPSVSYEADVLQFGRAGMDVAGVELGDATQCSDRGFDPDNPLAIEGRVLRIEVEELSPETGTKLTIGSLGPTLPQTISQLVDLQTSGISSRVSHIERGGTITYLEVLVDQLNEAINATGGWWYSVPNEGAITYDREVADPLVGSEATAVTQIKGGSIRIANSKKASFSGIDDWNWTTLVTAGHITASLVTAAQIVAGYIRSPNGTFIDLDNDTAQLGRTDGPHATFNSGGMSVYDSTGRVTAQIADDLARIGYSGAEHVLIEDGYVEIRNNNHVIAHFGYEEDLSQSIQRMVSYLTLGTRKAVSSHPRGDYSSSFGTSNAASGDHSHARGNNCVASGEHAYARGNGCTASGDHSCAVGEGCTASAERAVAIGHGLRASSPGQVVLGSYNLADSTGKYEFIFGDGTAQGRSNLFALTNDGNCPLVTTTESIERGSIATSARMSGWRCLNVVQVAISVSVEGPIGGADAVDARSSATLGKLPAGWRPVTTAALDAGAPSRRASVATDGTIIVYTSTDPIGDGATVYLRGTFLVPESSSVI